MSQKKSPSLSTSPQAPGTPAQDPADRFKRLRKFFRLVKYFLISSVILTLMEIGVAYWLISSRWYLLVPKEQMTEFAKEIDAAPALPANFMRIYEARFPNHYHTTLAQQVFINYGERYVFRIHDIDTKAHCFCDLVYDFQRMENPALDVIVWDGRLQDLEYGFGMEKYSSPEKCFDYVMYHKIARLRTWATRDLFGFVYKPIEQFTDDELIEIIIMLKSKSHINRYDTPELFEKEFREYQEKLDRPVTPIPVLTDSLRGFSVDSLGNPSIVPPAPLHDSAQVLSH
jgi:hypothetical protein